MTKMTGISCKQNYHVKQFQIMSYGQTNGVLFPGPFAWMFAWWIMDRWADEQTSAAKPVSCEEFVQF